MSQVWKCDRCRRTHAGFSTDELPGEWVRRSMPVRGSKGARSSAEIDLCGVCDADLYRWLHDYAEQGSSS